MSAVKHIAFVPRTLSGLSIDDRFRVRESLAAFFGTPEFKTPSMTPDELADDLFGWGPDDGDWGPDDDDIILVVDLDGDLADFDVSPDVANDWGWMPDPASIVVFDPKELTLTALSAYRAGKAQ